MAARLSSTLLRTQTDRRLVALAAQGSEPAFEALVERYRRPLQGYCRRLLLPAEAAEDVVQQAFLSTWQALARGTEVQDARAWLYRVAHNAAINALKRSGYDHDQLGDALQGAEAPEEDLERRIAIRRTLAGLAALPELQREALLRTAVEGQSHEAVAQALGLTDGAVRGLVYRARAALREAATALTPAPAVQWAASAASSSSAPIAERVAEIVAGTGSAGAGALLVKGGATLLTAGALAGGAVVATDAPGERPRAKQPAPAPAARAVAAEADDVEEPRGRGRSRGRPALVKARRVERPARAGRRGGDDRPREDGDDGRRSSGPGSDDDERVRSGSSGPGSGEEGSRSGSSGSGSGGGAEDSSGPGSGSGDSLLGDTSSSGSTSSGSGSSGSGGGLLGDTSGSGSTSSGSGSSGSGDGLRSGSSGSGSSGSGSSGSDDPLDDD